MKGIVFIDDGEGALRFLTTGAFDELARRHELVLAVTRSPQWPPGLDELIANQPFRAVTVPCHWGRFLRWNELFDVSCIAYRSLSPSFDERQKASKIKDPVTYYKRSQLAKVYPLYRAFTEQRLGLHPDLLELTLQERPDFFVLASSLLDYHTEEVLYLAEHLRIPTTMLVAGWDNLSSKGLLFHHPTRIGVWGEQARRHAIEVQRIAPEKVDIVGAPHYDVLRAQPHVDKAAAKRELGVPEDKPLVLFGGAFRALDETELLTDLERAIDDGRLPQVHVLYRPHPIRAPRDGEEDFLSRTWKHVTMDPESVEGYRLGKRGEDKLATNYLDRMEYLQRMYRIIDALICPMSTLMLEALLCGVPSMASAFGDGRHVFGVDRASRMLHFKELYEVPGLVVCRSREDFIPKAAELIAQIGDEILSASLQRSTEIMVAKGERPYGERIASVVDTMLQHASPPAYAHRWRPGRRFDPSIWSSLASVSSKMFDRVARRFVSS